MKLLLATVVVTTYFALSAPTANADAAQTEAFLKSAITQTKQHVIYDGAYRRIGYPGGDIPANRGVCTDVVIRAYRAIGIDLQQRVHEDMQRNFDVYLKHWPKYGWVKAPDANIDHRRVPNLQTYLKRQHAELPVSSNAAEYRAGDVVTWMLPGNLPHIGIVTEQRSSDKMRPLIVHNIGRGPQLEDMLFDYPITGHYHYE